MNDDIFKYIVARIIDNAKDASNEYQESNSEFADGKCLAYYEVLDTIKNELVTRDIDITGYGFDTKIKNIT